ncbi:MAG TPA: M20/M25/M40 family metallo-hydrolase [Anaerolineales bacterium]|nr:M20/M25/M40 family metallo-hydrolase [Anaerolineales bacterium]
MNDLLSRLLNLAIAIQQVPAPTFQESQRAGLVRDRFTEEHLPVEIDPAGNVLARLAGAGETRPLVVSAHLDTVFPPSVDLHFERQPERVLAPGLGDNSLGVAGLFGLLWALRERGIALPGDLWLVANVCEEGLGDLKGIKAVVDRFGAEPLAYLVVEGMALGQVYHRGLGVRRYRITVRTPGGHSWIDYGQPSAVHELTALSARITALEIPRFPRTTLNIGVVSGGSSVNTIAAEAMLELDLRSEDGATLTDLAKQVEQLAHAAARPGVEVAADLIGRRPSGEIPASHPLVTLAQDCLREVGVEPHLNIGSTDANQPLSRGLPAVTVGLTTGGGAHTVHEFINTAPLEKGLEQLIQLVTKIW